MRYRHEQGVTLIEVLIATAILLIAIVPMVRVFVYELHVANRARKMTIATNLARDMAEEIRSQSFCDELASYTTQNYASVWPWSNWSTVRLGVQSFGLESGESATTSPGNGRIVQFDDVDDYNGWCRGQDCDCAGAPATCQEGLPLETFDGYSYDGANEYPNYARFTRQVRIRNIEPIVDEEYVRQEYPESPTLIRISRFFFENWSSKRLYTDTYGREVDATGQSRLKIIEVTVGFRGLGVEDLQVKDLSFSVAPISPPEGIGTFP